LNLRPLPRAILLLAAAFAAGWLASVAVGRWLGIAESETDLALIVERRHGLNGDLVAALQFQHDEAASWGSPQLERAVVEHVDDVTPEIDPFAGFAWKPLPARWGWLALSAGTIAIVALLYPAHTGVFLRRLALADVSYPTRTQIASLSINGQAVSIAETTILRAPAGLPLMFATTHAGERPRSGTVVLKSDAGATTEVSLKPSADSDAFSGTLAAFDEPLTFVVKLGDAATRPRKIEQVPQPVVTLDLVPTPPAYARANAPPAPPAGVRTAYVLEGSSVGVTVHSVNKPLQDVKLVLAQSRDRRADDSSDIAGRDNRSPAVAALSLQPSPDRMIWTLTPKSTPFETISEPLNFAIEVFDDDRLSLSEPLAGSIRLRADRPPRVTATAVVRRVLPTARPELSYAASDDFGVRDVMAKMTVRRADGSQTEHSVALPVERESPSEVAGRQALDFSSLQLAKGDQVVVTVMAEDVRGDRNGETANAEPLTFEVTDRQGLLTGLLEADEEGAERLDAIIRRELGIGAQR
ncbi:MAG: DUF4175 domain-containing protein, partial [Planctomycetota bacterium]|nr:DUF4175 domain-containing protein [Planctomycetota bacterium]